jgi:hypothetical protein
MKKLFAIVTAMGFALSLGVAFAYESPDMSTHRGGKLFNGITYFETGQGCSLSEETGASGSGAGGMSAAESSAVVGNGVTHFEGAAKGSISKCSWAKGEEGLIIDNGVTYFGPRPKALGM